ncbi:hypothetical protein BJ508DRAFT_414889 [Ascobolus immersus RN42]|uniref:Uncharacterized protein n=1 Tax=Ascobolus immersus RN42 TaxID=1160509 RepID=A0A3N4IAL3_ASCIM|nr:hypothetical protein BJ508DRAFT_414889 [Ascobolus immersus RN42]
MVKLTGRTLQMPLVAGCCSIIVAAYVFSSLRSARNIRDTEDNREKRRTSAHYSSSGWVETKDSINTTNSVPERSSREKKQ